MDEITVNNRALLCGTAVYPPVYSHESRGVRFFVFPLSVRRLSGTQDQINIVARESLLAQSDIQAADRLAVSAELRSFNNRSGIGPRLVISAYAREVALSSLPDENRVTLCGSLCRPPILRVTPMGRQICDLMLAVPRRYRRSDYIPVIAWGLQARDAALWPVGTQIRADGRIQSRSYTKLVDGEPTERTAFELSAGDIYPIL